MNQEMLAQAGRATLAYLISGVMVSVELGIVISLIWFQKHAWVFSAESPSVVQIMEEMPLVLGLSVLSSVPLVLVHSLFLFRLLKRKASPAES